MARRARPWFRASRRMWYITHDGKQIPLEITDPNDEAAAWAAFKRLQEQARGKVPTPPRTVAEVVAAFLADCRGRVKPRTVKGYDWYLSHLLARNGTDPVTGLTADQIETLARRSAWSNSTRHNFLATAGIMLRWAGVKLDRPLRKPGKESAGADSVIPEETYRRMLTHCRGDWHAVIVFLWNTGARPGEAAAVEFPMVDWDAGVIRLKDHKTRATSHADRLVYFNPAAAEVLGWQREKYDGTGLAFRSHFGAKFSTQAFVQKFWTLSKAVGRRVNSYGLRHSFATRALAGGESDTIVAALLGHANTTMVHKHYAHVAAMGRQLADAAARIGKAS